MTNNISISMKDYMKTENVAVTDTPEFRLFRDAVIQPKWMERIHNVIVKKWRPEVGLNCGDPSKPYTCGHTGWLESEFPDVLDKEINGMSVEEIINQRAAKELGNDFVADEFGPYQEIRKQIVAEFIELPTTDYRYWFLFRGSNYLHPVYLEVLQEALPEYSWELGRKYLIPDEHTTIFGFRPPAGELVVFDLRYDDAIQALYEAGMIDILNSRMDCMNIIEQKIGKVLEKPRVYIRPTQQNYTQYSYEVIGYGSGKETPHGQVGRIR